MKKTLLLASAFMGLPLASQAQDLDPESMYIRNSVYMLKLDQSPESEEYADAYRIMNETFDKIDFAARYHNYNDFSLPTRHLKYDDLPTVTQEEKNAVGKESKAAQMLREQMVELGFKSPDLDQFEAAARIKKYLDTNDFARQLVAKWHVKPGSNPDKVAGWDDKLTTIMELGAKGLSEEARANAVASENLTNVVGGCENQLLNNTYVCVNHYRYVTAEERMNTIVLPIQIGLEFLPGAARTIAQVAANVTIAAVKSRIKGYSVKTNAYLFRLNWNEDQYNKFYENYWSKPDEFNKSDDYSLEYVGRCSKFAGSSVSLKKSADTDALTAQATYRGTDAAFAALQKEYEQFRPMTTLHIGDGKMFAYIGTKEDVSEGDEYEVKQPVQNKKGEIEWKKVGTVKVAKKGVWDNREKLVDNSNEAAGDEDEIEENNLSYTVFDGKPNEKYRNCMIRLLKAKKKK